jgi:hypothetical protein
VLTLGTMSAPGPTDGLTASAPLPPTPAAYASASTVTAVVGVASIAASTPTMLPPPSARGAAAASDRTATTRHGTEAGDATTIDSGGDLLSNVGGGG